MLKDSALQPVVGVTGYDESHEENVIREMLSWRPAGLIVAGLEHTDASRAMMRAADIPIVEVMDVDGDPVDYCVGISHLEAGRMMATTILEKGYKNIGFIGTKVPRDFRARKRLQGFTQALAAEGVPLCDQELYSEGSSVLKGRELTEKLLKRTTHVDCIYYSSDVMSVGGLMHCLANGVSVPDDLAIAGFNSLELLDGLPVKLATTNSFRFEIGQKAASIVLSSSTGQSIELEKVIRLKPLVEVGQSL